MKFVKKTVKFRTSLVNPIIDLKGNLEHSQKGNCIAIKCGKPQGNNDSGSYEIDLPYYGRLTSKCSLKGNNITALAR